MFFQAKIEENTEINLLLSNPIYRKVFCRFHGFLYQYRCIHPHCNAFVCGKIECIDNHFHQNQLKIEKFNSKALIHKIKRVEELSHISETLAPIVNELKNSVDHLKQKSMNLFKDYKIFKSIADHLIQNLDDPIQQDYLTSMEEFQIIRERIQEQILGLGKSINWKNVWITLEDELQIAQKLKISFEQFRHVYFEIFEPSFEALEADDKFSLFQNRECEGIILLYFTHELYLIGEFIPNNNVDTCQLFIHNFLFVVNSDGEVDQYSTCKQVMTFYKPNHGPNYCIRIIDKQICDKQGLQEMVIKKVVCFAVHAETC